MDNILWVRIKQDYWAYIVILIALGIALYALMVVKDYENKCNDHWLAQMEKCECMCLQQQPEPWAMNNTYVKQLNITIGDG